MTGEILRSEKRKGSENMKRKKLSLIFVISVLLAINLIPVIETPIGTTSTKQRIVDTTPMTEVWQVGDWVSYDVSLGLFVMQYDFTIINVTSDYIAFAFTTPSSSDGNVSCIYVNATTGQLYGQPYIGDLYNVTNPFNLLFSFLNVDLSIFEEFTEIEPIFYESHALIHVDDSPVVIPVTGVTYKYSNISDTQPYNYTTYNWTDYSSETTLVQMHTNYSVQIEIHEPTGILVNILFASYSNVTMSLFDVPYTMGLCLHLTDSHGVFDLSEEPTTTEPPTDTTEPPTTTESTETPYGLGLALIGMACIYMRRRNKK